MAANCGCETSGRGRCSARSPSSCPGPWWRLDDLGNAAGDTRRAVAPSRVSGRRRVGDCDAITTYDDSQDDSGLQPRRSSDERQQMATGRRAAGAVVFTVAAAAAATGNRWPRRAMAARMVRMEAGRARVGEADQADQADQADLSLGSNSGSGRERVLPGAREHLQRGS